MRKILTALSALIFILSLTACADANTATDTGEMYYEVPIEADESAGPGAVAVSAASLHTLALMDDGTLWAWGVEGIGDGTTDIHRRPVQIMENINFALAGHDVSFAIDNDGVLWGWGGNWLGSLGNGTTEPALSPIQIMEDVVYVAIPQIMLNSHAGGGNCRTYAIDIHGTLWAWGHGSGEYVAWDAVLGDGHRENRLTPVPILENVVHVEPTTNGGFAYTADGQRWHWHGDIFHNDFVNGEWVQTLTPAALYPLPVPPYNPDYTVSHSGSYFAINEDGDLVAWGRNRMFDHWRPGPTLGDGTTIDRDEPVLILPDIAYVTVMGNNAYAIGTDGGLWMWGANNDPDVPSVFTVESEGVLWEYALHEHGGTDGVRWIGDNYADYGLLLSPVRILENVVSVVPTYYMLDHGWVRGARAFAITTNGAVYAWGENSDWHWSDWGLLGDGTSEFRPHPVRIIEGRE